MKWRTLPPVGSMWGRNRVFTLPPRSAILKSLDCRRLGTFHITGNVSRQYYVTNRRKTVFPVSAPEYRIISTAVDVLTCIASSNPPRGPILEMRERNSQEKCWIECDRTCWHMAHSTGLDNSLCSFQEYEPWGL